MAQELNTILASNALSIVKRLLNRDPTSLGPKTARWNSRGSLAVTFKGPAAGLWYDHECGEGGDLVALMARELGVDRRRALSIAREWLAINESETSTAIEARRDVQVRNKDRGYRVIALRLWGEAISITGTPADRYLERRGLLGPHRCSPRVIRWHVESSTMFALMTDPLTAEPTGIHRTSLDAQDRKIGRKMLGSQGVVRISRDDEVTTGLGICEGVEDALALIIAGWRPVWAATSAGAIARFFPIPGIEALTVFADRDAVGARAASACVARWRQAGREAQVVLPGGADG